MSYSEGILSKEIPNILWIITDEQRTDSLGCYGSPWAKTSNIDRFAQEGIIFKNAITPALVCVPARALLLTGKYPRTSTVLYKIRISRWYFRGGGICSHP